MRSMGLGNRLVAVAIMVLLLVPSTVVSTVTEESDGPPNDGLWDGNYTSRGPYVTTSGYPGLPGSGTVEDPYVLEGFIINGTSTQSTLDIKNCHRHIIIRNNIFQNESVFGIQITQSSKITFEDNIVRNFRTCGMYLTSVTDSVIRGNRILNTTRTAYASLELVTSANVTVEGNVFDDTPRSDHIYTSRSNGVVIRDNTFNNSAYAIDIGYDTDGVTILNNTLLSGIISVGISIFHSYNCTVSGNRLANSCVAVDPYELSDWFTMDIRGDNSINGTPFVSLKGATGEELTAPFSQLFIINSTDVSIDCTGQEGTFYGGAILYSSNVSILDGDLRGGPATLQLHGSNITVSGLSMDRVNLEAQGERVHISNCSSKGGRPAISIGGTDCSIRDCVIGPSEREAITVGTGFYFGYRAANNITISNNTITFDTYEYYYQHVGIDVYWQSRNLTIRGNSFTRYGIHMSEVASLKEIGAWTSHVITPDNTVNGTPILYYANRQGLDITGSVGQLIMANCSHFRVHDMSIVGSEWPVQVGLSDNCTFERNDIQQLGTTIDLTTVQDVTLERNDLDGTGIYISIAERVQVSKNVIANAKIRLRWVDGCTIRNNLITGDGYAIQADTEMNVTVCYNQFEGCLLGMKVDGYRFSPSTSVVYFHHNNLIDNNKDPLTGETRSPQCTFTYATITWDDGAEGNYWSEYQQRYPGASHDGNVWNISYEVSEGSGDRYPLIEPVDVSAPVAGVDRLEHTVPQGTTVVFDASTSTDDVGVENYTWALDYDGRSVEGHGAVWSFLFDIPGTYVVRLTVRDAEGNWDDLEVLVTVLDTESPVADAGPDVHVGQGTNVTLDGSGSTDNVGISDWNWTFQYDGADVELHGERANWTFDTPGVYTVNLTVTDASDLTDADTMDVTVHDTAPPVADAGEDQTIPYGANVTLNASGSSDNVGIAHWNWTFVYDTAPVYLQGEVVHFTFELVGRFEVTLLVTDAEGNEATDIVVITVIDDEPPVIATQTSIEARAGVPVVLDATGSTDNAGIASYDWTFTEGGETVRLEGPRRSHTFSASGIYPVTLRVTDVGGNVAEAVVTVTVRDVTIPVADAGPDLEVDQGEEVTLDGSGSTDDVAVTGWEWTFEHGGEAVTLTGARPTFTFDLAGIYTVTLRVVDADGNADTDTVTVTVRDTERPVADAGPDLEVMAGAPFTLDGSNSTDNVGIVRWVWTAYLGDDMVTALLEGETVEVNLIFSGLHIITLMVVDAEGNEGFDNVEVFAQDPDRPIARAGEDIEVGMGTEVVLDGTGSTSRVPVRTYAWTFAYNGQDVTLEGATATFRFDRPGVFNVTLTVTNTLGNADDDSLVVRVWDTAPPVARLVLRGELRPGATVVLADNGSTDNVAVVNWTWTVLRDGGAGMTFHGTEVEYVIPGEGHYRFILIVRDAEGNEGSDAVEVDIRGDGEGEGAPLGLAVVLVVVIVAALVGALVFQRSRRARGEGGVGG